MTFNVPCSAMSRPGPKRIGAALPGAIAAVMCFGCVSLEQTEQQVAVRPAGARAIDELLPVGPSAAKHLPYARLSWAAYQRSEKDEERVADCTAPRKALLASGWTRWDDFSSAETLKQQLDAVHLHMEVWSRTEPPEIAVAFGGTVFSDPIHWLSNLRWFLPAHVDQYSTLVANVGPAFVAEVRKRIEKGAWRGATPRIVTTGHSLGGGLAQQFAYALPLDPAVPRVTAVYAFRPSPVTGYFALDTTLREANAKGLEIERIYERGEILAYLRSIQNMVLKPSDRNPAVSGYRYSLVKEFGPVTNHSIAQMACSLAQRAS